jgi:hypothetical protein
MQAVQPVLKGRSPRFQSFAWAARHRSMVWRRRFRGRAREFLRCCRLTPSHPASAAARAAALATAPAGVELLQLPSQARRARRATESVWSNGNGGTGAGRARGGASRGCQRAHTNTQCLAHHYVPAARQPFKACVARTCDFQRPRVCVAQDAPGWRRYTCVSNALVKRALVAGVCRKRTWLCL